MKHLISVPPNTIPYFHQLAALPEREWYVSADPEGTKVGSGGGTAHLLSNCFRSEKASDFDLWLRQEKRIIIHAGGQSRRLPSYAPIGKSLLPMPVFRWSRGQQLNQRLIHLQTPLFEKILDRAPDTLNTLIASGDTLIFSGKTIPAIPEADIVCFGMWIEPEKAANHGVFFARHESPDELQFMLQKPSITAIKELIHQYYFLMDIGIWLLSPKAMQILMKKSGWNGSEYSNGLPEMYDLYSEFGLSLGNLPSEKDAEINQLSTALVNLEGGEFYHFGNSSELISSNLAIQNRITDQREIWHRQIKPHPSMFILNAEVKAQLKAEHNNIWIENASIPEDWNLSGNHVLSNIPENSWKLELPKGSCLDLIPLNDNKVAVRNYGYSDTFRGQLSSPETRFMEESLSDWLQNRGLTGVFSSLNPETDIQFLPLFPVFRKEEIQEGFLNWLVNPFPEANTLYTELWINAKRISPDEVGQNTDIALIHKQTEEQQLKAVRAIAKNYANSVFYQLDLEKLAEVYVQNQINLPEINGEKTGNWLPIHYHMFRAAVEKRNSGNWETEERKAFDYLRASVLEYFQRNPADPRVSLLPDQIAWGRSPVRLDLAGGWTDTPPYCFLYGGKVINLAVELNGQPPLHCYIKATKDPVFIIRSIDLGAQETIKTFDQLRDLHQVGSPFAIPKAALALAGYLPEFAKIKFPSLEKQLSESGGGLEISILAAVPKGSGLGTSSILAATVLGTLSEVCCLTWNKLEIGRRTLALEQLLTTGGGWQDQFGGILEGIKVLETTSGKTQSPEVKWLPETLFTAPEYKNRILLYYTGITRVAKSILAEIVRGMFLNSGTQLSILEELKQHAENTCQSVSLKNYDALAANILRSWQLNQRLDAGTNTPEIQKMIDLISPYSSGYKLLGAGGGGFMLIFARDEEAVVRIKTELTNNPVNERARFVDFSISKTGLQVTKS